MGSINKLAVKAMYDNYHRKIKTNPTLYTNKRDGNGGILISLSKELVDFCERTAGHHGFGQSATPVGICRKVSDARRALDDIFGTPDSLERFILTSACDADAYMAEVRERHSRKLVPTATTTNAPVDPLDRPAREFNLTKIYYNGILRELQDKYPKTIRHDFDTLTLWELTQRYSLPQPDLA